MMKTMDSAFLISVILTSLTHAYCRYRERGLPKDEPSPCKRQFMIDNDLSGLVTRGRTAVWTAFPSGATGVAERALLPFTVDDEKTALKSGFFSKVKLFFTDGTFAGRASLGPRMVRPQTFDFAPSKRFLIPSGFVMVLHPAVMSHLVHGVRIVPLSGC